MVNAHELRVGNYFCVAEDGIPNVGVPEYVEVVRDIMTGDSRFKDCVNFDRETFKCRDCEDIFGIPFTEEWLLKLCGTESTPPFYGGYGRWFLINGISIKCVGRIFFFEMDQGRFQTNIKIEFVHTFQNLIFALKCKELTIK